MQMKDWLYWLGDMISNKKSFLSGAIIIGVGCAIIQMISYRFSDEPNMGSELFFTILPLTKLQMTALFLMGVKCLIYLLSKKWQIWPCINAWVTFVSQQAAIAGRFIGGGLIGFGTVVFISGAYTQVSIYVLGSLYALSLAKVSTEPLPFTYTPSISYWLGYGMIIGLPIGSWLLKIFTFLSRNF